MSAIRTYLPVAGVLLLILRPPFGWDQKLIVAMQRSATAWASGVLDLGGIRHLADGVVIRLPERDFFVDEACSGVHSLFATLAFVAVFAVATRRGALKSLLLFVSAIFWVLVANTLRVIAVVVLSARYDLPVLDGVGHETLGVLVFALVIGLVLSTDRLLLFLFPQREQLLAVTGSAGFERASVMASGAAVRSQSFPLAVATLFVLIAVGISVLPAQAMPRSNSPFASAQGLRPVPREALPATWNGWEQVAFQVREREQDDPAGEISRIWTYRKGRLVTAISIDGPFDAWHDTEVCYHGLGYSTQTCGDIEIRDGSAVPSEFTELVVTSGSGQHGYVLFMAYDTNGQALRPPVSRNASVARFVAAWRQRVAGEVPADPLLGRVYQVQLFAENRLSHTVAEREELTHLFHHMRREIARNSTLEKQESGLEGGST
jgi:exosortase/archaeosortase family protein